MRRMGVAAQKCIAEAQRRRWAEGRAERIYAEADDCGGLKQKGRFSLALDPLTGEAQAREAGT